MKVSKNLKLLLLYEWDHGEIPVAEIKNPELIVQAKELALEEAKEKLEAVGWLDPIIRIDKEYELRKKTRMLNYLIPVGHNHK